MTNLTIYLIQRISTTMGINVFPIVLRLVFLGQDGAHVKYRHFLLQIELSVRYYMWDFTHDGGNLVLGLTEV